MRLLKCRRTGPCVPSRVKGSNGWRKAVRNLKRVHEHVASQRADFVHKLSRRIARGCQLIAVEKSDFDSWTKGMVAKQVHDAGCSSFLQALTVKAAKKWTTGGGSEPGWNQPALPVLLGSSKYPGR